MRYVQNSFTAQGSRLRPPEGTAKSGHGALSGIVSSCEANAYHITSYVFWVYHLFCLLQAADFDVKPLNPMTACSARIVAGVPARQLSPLRVRCRDAARRSGSFLGRATAVHAPAQHTAKRGQRDSLLQLYPATAALTTGYLKVSDIHRLAYWEYGNRSGIPVVAVHGGPGAGSFANHA
jgi:hypothetical protein